MKLDRSAMARVAERMQRPVHVELMLEKAFRWWLGELASFVPTGLRRGFAGLRSRYVILSDGTGLSLWRETGAENKPLGRVDPRAPAIGQRALTALRRDHAKRPLNILLRLSPDKALRIVAPLPLAAERNLDQVVGFEFERLMPFRRDEVYCTHRVVTRDKAAQSLRIELTAVPRAEIGALVQTLAPLGLDPALLEIPAATPLDPPDQIALEGSGQRAAASHARLVLGALALIAFVLTATAGALPFLRAQARLDGLTEQLAAARREAELSAKLQNQIDARLRDQRLLVDRRFHTPTATELLDTLTNLVPDDSWLTELQIMGADIRLTGASTSATALLGLIDQSTTFRNATFRSPVVQDQRLGRERFDIGAQVKTREDK